jgi:hypothetical protein
MSNFSLTMFFNLISASCKNTNAPLKSEPVKEWKIHHDLWNQWSIEINFVRMSEWKNDWTKWDFFGRTKDGRKHHLTFNSQVSPSLLSPISCFIIFSSMLRYLCTWPAAYNNRQINNLPVINLLIQVIGYLFGERAIMYCFYHSQLPAYQV